MRTLIANGTIVTAAGSFAADVLVEGERIVLIGADLPGRGVTADELIDATGRYVIPGGIDVHTHMELPFGGTYAKDTFESGTKAATDTSRCRRRTRRAAGPSRPHHGSIRLNMPLRGV